MHRCTLDEWVDADGWVDDGGWVDGGVGGLWVGG